MEDRIAVLERDVEDIKAELAVLRRDCERAEELIVRVTRIELDLVVVKGDLGQLRKDVSLLQRDVSLLQRDVSLLQSDLSLLQSDLSLLQRDVSQLRHDVSLMQSAGEKFGEELLSVRMELTKLNTEIAHCASKADLHLVQAGVKASEANIKGWMLGIALSLITVTFAMIYPLYGVLRSLPSATPAQSLQQGPNQQGATRGAPVPPGVR